MERREISKKSKEIKDTLTYIFFSFIIYTLTSNNKELSMSSTSSIASSSTLIRIPNPEINRRIEANRENCTKLLGRLFPEVTLSRYNSRDKIENFSSSSELLGKRSIIMFVPGAWDNDSTVELVDFIQKESLFKESLKVQKIIFIVPDGLNSAREWNKVKGDPEKIEVWADNDKELVDKTGLGFNNSQNGEGYVFEKAVMLVEDALIQFFNMIKSPGGHATVLYKKLSLLLKKQEEEKKIK